MSTYFGKSYSFGLLCVSFMNVYHFVRVFFSSPEPKAPGKLIV